MTSCGTPNRLRSVFFANVSTSPVVVSAGWWRERNSVEMGPGLNGSGFPRLPIDASVHVPDDVDSDALRSVLDRGVLAVVIQRGLAHRIERPYGCLK